MAVSSPAAPSVPWADFAADFRWRQGEHVTLIGPTNAGKTTLARELLNDGFPYAVAFAPKRRDPVVDDLRRDGFVRIEDWTVADPDVLPRVVLNPILRRGVDSLAEQKAVYQEALRSIYKQGGWRLYLDECRHITDFLGLAREVELLAHQGRSLGVSLMASLQRPRHVPLVLYDQATHLFIWHNADADMRKRLADMSGKVDAATVAEVVADLGDHEVCYVAPREGTVLRTRVDLR